MSIITLSIDDFAKLVSTYPVEMLPVAVAGFVYCVVKGSGNKDIYRVAIA